MPAETPPAEAPDPAPGSDPAARARAGLAGTRFADLRWVASTGSTNADAMALARDGAAEGIVVVADHQTAGRGRLGRTWEAPPGASLLVSVLLRPPALVLDAMTMAAGVAMVDAVATVAGVTASLKWPNDLVVATAAGERKLAGMLAEADWPAGSTASGGPVRPAGTQRLALVVGVGVNVDWPAEVPGELADVLTSCNHLTGHPADRAELLVAFLDGLDASYERLLADPGDRAWLLDAYRARSATIGRRVRIDTGSSEVLGAAVDVDVDGRLLVDDGTGAPRPIAVGDVVHLRQP